MKKRKVITHKKCPEYVADHASSPHPMHTDPPCRNCGGQKKGH